MGNYVCNFVLFHFATINDDGPCIICKKEIINAGIHVVFMREDGVGDTKYTSEDIKNLLSAEENRWRIERVSDR